MRITLFFLFCLVLAGCDQLVEKDETLNIRPVSFEDLPGWQDDDLLTFVPAFEKSCEVTLKKDPSKPFVKLEQAGTIGEWQVLCKNFAAIDKIDSYALRQFFLDNFTPHAVFAGEEQTGLFTGYYEAHLRGSYRKGSPYTVPLHSRPDDLVMVHLGHFREHLKGQRIAGRVENGTLRPYESREQIVAGDWPHEDKVLLWVDDPVDAFFVQIQGSGVVELPNDRTVRIGYAGQNGHPYYAIGRELIARGLLEKEAVSMQSIRDVLAQDIALAEEIMNTNASYVFFRLLETDGPVGGSGVVLTPQRSLAIDHTLLPYGAPIWLSADAPVPESEPFQKLMVTQDTGGAIRGPVRGDVFWGYGDFAETKAGQMKSNGRYWILLPSLKNSEMQQTERSSN